MNELIRELVRQAGLDDTDFPIENWDNVPLAKFAKLIVRECEKVISDGRYSVMACEGNSYRVSYNNGRYGAILDIKKHFGVEA